MVPVRRLVLILLLAAAARTLAGQGAPVWHHQLAAPITNAGILSNGALAVFTDSGLSVLAPKRRDLSVAGWQWLLRNTDTTFVIYPTRGGPMRLDRRTLRSTGESTASPTWRPDT